VLAPWQSVDRGAQPLRRCVGLSPRPPCARRRARRAGRARQGERNACDVPGPAAARGGARTARRPPAAAAASPHLPDHVQALLDG
jgi:hypothetical protein